MTLILHLLGQPQIALDDRPIKLSGHRPVALLTYLLLTRKAHSRQHLIDLLYDNSDDPQASLRWTLHQLQKAIGSGYISADREQIAFNFDSDHTLDVTAFTSGRTDLYRGDLLDGLHLRDAQSFMDWLLFERERLRDIYQTALVQQLETHAAQANHPAVIETAQALIRLDNLREEWHRALMLAYARLGKREAALAQFDHCRQLLHKELDIEPAAETVALAQAIRSGRLETPAQPTPDRLSPAKQIDRRALLILLDRVRNFWIDGVLDQALHGLALIDTGKETRPDAVSAAWADVLPRPNSPRQLLPINASIAKVFAETGRALLILGEPGSGKTTLLLDLARELITRATTESDQPVPVVFNLAAWADRAQPLTEWLIGELNEKYLIPKSIGRTWIDHDQLVLLLDGLDEVKRDQQAACVIAINRFRHDHGLTPIAVCSRVADYESLASRLELQSALALQPLTPQQVRDYLNSGDDRLKEVQAAIDSDAALQELARSPLMLSIISLTYRDLPLYLNEAASVEERRRYLLTAYVQHCLQRHKTSDHFATNQTQHWLTWLAQHLTAHHQTLFLIEKLQASWLSDRVQCWLYALATHVIGGLAIIIPTLAAPTTRSGGSITETAIVLSGVVSSLVFGIKTALQYDRRSNETRSSHSALNTLIELLWASVIVGPIAWLFMSHVFQPRLMAMGIAILILAFWIFFGLRERDRDWGNDIQTADALAWSWQRARRGAFGGGLIGLAAAIAQWVAGELLGSSSTPIAEALLALSIILFCVLAGLLLRGLSHGVVKTTIRPNQGLRQSIRSALISGLIAAVFASAYSVLAFTIGANYFDTRIMGEITDAASAASLGIAIGAWAALWYGALAVIDHAILRIMLWWHNYLPWCLITFLDYVTAQGLLRKVGGGYLFAHPLLQEYFARFNSTP